MIDEPGMIKAGNLSKDVGLSMNAAQSSLIDSMPLSHDDDSIERMTVLGMQLTNPYTVPIMQQGYANLGLSSMPVNVTNLYVRFLPTTDQVSALDSIIDAQGLDLFNTPMDYQVLQEGDYYQDPSIPTEQPTWQYAVVPPNFQFPSGIQYQTLAQIHIPGDNYTAVETEAERLAALQDNSGGGSVASNSTGGIMRPNGIKCAFGYHWDTDQQRCVPDNCPNGYHWDDFRQSCVPNTPPPNPPPPAPDASVPAGNITVFDTQLPGAANNHLFPVRKARMVAKRWFKVERTYTDDNGHFQFTKHYKDKVKLVLKFQNSDGAITCMRAFRLWQILLPFNRTLGVYSGDKSNIAFNFQKFDNSGSGAKGNRFWATATVLNAVQEYKDYAPQEGIGLPRSNLRILMTNLVGFNTGSSPMFNKRWYAGLPQEVGFTIIATVVNPIVGGMSGLVVILKHQVDVTISYTGPTGFYGDFHSDHLKETIYHELTHTAHYAALSSGWYTQFVNSEIAQMISNFSTNALPYGTANTSDAAIIAVGESWAYHIGHYLADKRYGQNSSNNNVGEQGVAYPNNVIPGFSSHLTTLELFDPNYTPDPFHWIPIGLYNDLMDARNESRATGGPVDDNVTGYTNQQFFNAFNSSITSMQLYKTNLLQQNPNNQAAQVSNLFQQYGY